MIKEDAQKQSGLKKYVISKEELVSGPSDVDRSSRNCSLMREQTAVNEASRAVEVDTQHKCTFIKQNYRQ